MAAYMIVTAQVHDRVAFMERYAKDTATLMETFGGRYVLRGPGAELLEGNFGDGAAVVISEWPDKAAARRFWDSPEYSELKARRQGLADVQVVLIEAPKITVA